VRKPTASQAPALVLTGPVLTGPVLTGPVLTGPVLTGPVLAAQVLTGPKPTGQVLTGLGPTGLGLAGREHAVIVDAAPTATSASARLARRCAQARPLLAAGLTDRLTCRQSGQRRRPAQGRPAWC
jgi:hypothetical protein